MAQIYSLDGVQVDAVPPSFALYPYGAFTSFVVADGAVLGWHHHVDRLAVATDELWGHDLDRARLCSVTRRHFELQGPGPASTRITVYPSSFSLAAPDEASGCSMLISSSPTQLPFEPRASFAVKTAQHTRGLAHLKSTDLFTQISLRRAARLEGFDDCLLMSGDEVLEGATWSVLVLRNGRVVTPEARVLRSITVTHLSLVARALGWSFAHEKVSLSDLFGADLVLGVNVNNPARAISHVDGKALSVDAELLGSIARAFRDLPSEIV